MARSIQQVLAPKTVLRAISQIELPGTSLSRMFGWHLAGRNKTRQAGRNFSYDIFNNTRHIATGRGPGQSSSRVSPHSVGSVVGTFPRSAETISLLDEELLNRRDIGGPSSQLDQRGESFITRQEAYLAQRFANLVEFQTAAMLRGSYSFNESGDELRHSFGAGEVNVDFQIPAGNKDGLDMLGDGDILADPWSDSATDIPLHLQRINAALVELTGLGLAHVVLTGTGWQHVVNNAKVQALGGSANVSFESMKRVGPGEFSAVLRAIPWVTFHVIDYGLEAWNGTSVAYTRLIDDDHAAFFPEVSSRWVQYVEGSEMVTEGPRGPKSEQYGLYAYAYPTHDPSGWDLCAVHNGIPALYTPKAVAYGAISA
ncbi:MAG: major capsid protein [Planctomycetales bacterium]|nr:major capsid protein [Planctomycetales bacterium]